MAERNRSLAGALRELAGSELPFIQYMSATSRARGGALRSGARRRRRERVPDIRFQLFFASSGHAVQRLAEMHVSSTSLEISIILRRFIARSNM
jgi:hypothetical protein